jgi:regulator of sirC expression with transglutaminase-like and TPR domain
MTIARFRALLAQPDADLLQANLCIARTLGNPDLDEEMVIGQICAYATVAAERLGASGSIRERALALADFLFVEMGLHGNAAGYHDPRNSFLNEVLASSQGIPISLSMVYLEIAMRLGIPARGIGMPGHFLVQVGLEPEVFFIDPFDGGRELSRAECEALMRTVTGHRGAFDKAWLDPVPNREIVARQLRNLNATYLQAQEWQQAQQAIVLLRIVEPDDPRHIRDLGLAYYQSGDRIRGCYYLEQYLARSPEALDGPDLKRGLRERLDHWAVQN